jgi:octaprenyl-diphosphate synthase
VGKSLGTDLAKGKLTLPVLLCLEKASPAERARLELLIGQWDAHHLPEIVELVEKHDGLNLARDIVHKHLQQARKTLGALPASPGRDGLTALTRFLAHQVDGLGALD